MRKRRAANATRRVESHQQHDNIPIRSEAPAGGNPDALVSTAPGRSTEFSRSLKLLRRTFEQRARRTVAPLVSQTPSESVGSQDGKNAAGAAYALPPGEDNLHAEEPDEGDTGLPLPSDAEQDEQWRKQASRQSYRRCNDGTCWVSNAMTDFRMPTSKLSGAREHERGDSALMPDSEASTCVRLPPLPRAPTSDALPLPSAASVESVQSLPPLTGVPDSAPQSTVTSAVQPPRTLIQPAASLLSSKSSPLLREGTAARSSCDENLADRRSFTPAAMAHTTAKMALSGGSIAQRVHSQEGEPHSHWTKPISGIAASCQIGPVHDPGKRRWRDPPNRGLVTTTDSSWLQGSHRQGGH